MAEGEQSQTDRENTKRNIHPVACQTGESIRKLEILTASTASYNRGCFNSLCQSMSRCLRMTALAIVWGGGAKDAILRIKEYIEQGYTRAVVLDLSRYFDTPNHTILLNQTCQRRGGSTD